MHQQRIRGAEEYAKTGGVLPELLSLLKLIDKHQNCTVYLALANGEKHKFVYGTYVGLAGAEPHLVLLHPRKYSTKNEENIASGMEQITPISPQDESKHCHVAFDNIREEDRTVFRPPKAIVITRTEYEGRTYLAVNLFIIRAVRIHGKDGGFLLDFKLGFEVAGKNG